MKEIAEFKPTLKLENMTIPELAFGKLFKDRRHVNDAAVNEAAKKAEDWIWVEGYKGTDKDMCCRGQQYEIGKQIDMPEGEEVKECKSGFHLCLKLDDVFSYYHITDGNRFFKVRALVRKADIEKYGNVEADPYAPWIQRKNNKLAARSIEFVRECTLNEIFEGFEWAKDYTDEEKQIALNNGRSAAEKLRRKAKLINLGYSEAFSDYISNSTDRTDRAIALANVPGLSMDVKVLSIFVDED